MIISDALHMLAIGAFALALVWATVTDFLYLRVLNATSVLIVAVYPLYVVTAPAAIDWLGALAVAGVVFAVGFVMFVRNWFGGGDAKLLTAVALWAGPTHILPVLLITGLAGGVLALAMISPAKYLFASILPIGTRTHAGGTVEPSSGEHANLKMSVPYAFAIAVGGLWIVPNLVGL